jgi:hypothetical protein
VRHLAAGAIALVTAVSGFSRTSLLAAEQTIAGTVSDAACGRSHAGMPKPLSDRECTQDCTSKGTQYVLVTDAKIYKLTGHAGDLKNAAGATATIIGDVDGDTIRVSKVEK